MSKQDRGGVRTAQNLEQKYNLGLVQKTAKQSAANVNRVEADLQAFMKEINSEVDDKAESGDIPTKVSQLENDEGFLTEVTEENLPTEYLEQLIATAIKNAYIEVENEAGGITVIIGHG